MSRFRAIFCRPDVFTPLLPKLPGPRNTWPFLGVTRTLCILCGLLVGFCAIGYLDRNSEHAANQVLREQLAEPESAGAALSSSPDPDSNVYQEMVKLIKHSRNSSADPCEDFYQYVCGGFLESTHIPPSRSSWSLASDGVELDHKQVVLDILETDYPMIGPFWDSCMDEHAIEQADTKPLTLSIELIKNAKKGWRSMMTALSHIHLMGVDSMWTYEVARDANTNPVRKNLQLTAAGTFLPDQSYYHDKATMNAYKRHVSNMFALLDDGTSGHTNDLEASLAVDFEARLCGWKPKKPVNNPLREYNPYSFPKLAAMLDDEGKGNIGGEGGDVMKSYLMGMDIALHELVTKPEEGDFVLDNPSFFAHTLRYIDFAFEEGQGDAIVGVQAYLKWSLLHHFSSSLPRSFVEENFRFFGKYLAGQQEPKSRQELCLDELEKSNSLGFILSKYYVSRAFDEGEKVAGMAMTQQIEEAFLKEVIPNLKWMDHTTRKACKNKTLAITNKVGYPDVWPPTDPCYSSVSLDNHHYMRNVIDLTRCEKKRQLVNMKDGIRAHRAAWDSPSTATNAMYLPDSNTIEIPAAMLQPPYFFSTHLPAAFNFGSAGSAIGHEFTHAFDQQGHMYGPHGKLSEWWPREVEREYARRVSCVVDLYDGRVVDPAYPNECVDGKATINENIADIGGLRLAFRAFRRHLDTQKKHGHTRKVAGLTPHQLFFVAFGISWCQKDTPEYMKQSVRMDEHAPPKFRVNVPVSQVEAFADAFQCHEKAPLNPPERCSSF